MDRCDIFSDEYLNALVDDQLGSAERDRVFAVFDQSPVLRTRLSELRNLKAMVRHAYRTPARYPTPRLIRTKLRPASLQSLAASLLLVAAGGLGGWWAHDNAPEDSESRLATLFHTMQLNDRDVVPARYVVHVDTDNPVRLDAALDETERLLDTPPQAGQSTRVEVVASGPGIDLLLAGVSPYAARITALQRKYPNLDLTACGQTIRRLRQQGIKVRLLPHTKIATSALDEIIARHLQQHWAYIKI